MAWIESHQSLSRHRKTLRAAALLRCDRHKLIGHLHEFWWWALDNVPSDGALGETSDDELEGGAQWDGEPGAFVAAITRAGFLDTGPDGRAIHDWYEFAGKLLTRREDNAERQRRKRERDRLSSNSARNGDVTRTSRGTSRPSHGATVPNPTVPNPTQPPPTTPEDRKASADADAPPAVGPAGDPPFAPLAKVARERERDAVWDELASIFGEPLTDDEHSRRNAACKKFRDAGGKHGLNGPQMAALIRQAHEHWPNVMASATETPHGLLSNLSLLVRGPQVNGRSAGTVRQHTQRLTESATVRRGQDVSQLADARERQLRRRKDDAKDD